MSNDRKEVLMNKKTALGRQMFSPYEDMKLKMLVMQIGCTSWKNVASYMPNRTARQCRERYRNYLAPDLVNGPWTKEEDEMLKKLYKTHGSKWSTITKFFKDRSEINVKNRWTSISKTFFNEIQHEQQISDTSQNICLAEDNCTKLMDSFTPDSFYVNTYDCIWNIE